MTTHYWLVTLLLRLGEYEKHVTQIQHTTSKDKAGYDALCDETHNEPLTRAQYNRGDEWWDDCYIYEVYSVQPIDIDHIATLKLYL